MVADEKKIAILYVNDILKKYTDENHCLTYSQIADKLQGEYDLKLDIKTIAKLITCLQGYGADIVKKGNYGCALISRKFDSSELSFLIDAIFSSKSISSKNAKLLIQTLMEDCSIYERRKYNYIEKADKIVRHDNKEFFYTIDTITRAIETGKQISFTYDEIIPNKKMKKRFDGKKFIMNPYFMINNRGKYYLVCNYDKYNNLSNYRIECISNIKILDTDIKPLRSLDDTADFEISDYVNEHIYMFSGKTIQVTIKIDSPKVINDIIDWYGENISIREGPDEILVSFNVNEQAFLYWALQYGASIEIIKPLTTKRKYIEMLESIISKYKNSNKGE